MMPGRTIVKWAAGVERTAALLARCTSAGRTPAAARTSTAARNRSTWARAGVGGLARERAAEDDDRSADTRVPELHAFLDGRDAERAGAGLDEGARRGDGAVPVAVGLDDREDLHAGTDELARRAEIRPQRPEAHLGDRGPTLVFEHGAAAEKGVPIANGSPPFHSDPLTC